MLGSVLLMPVELQSRQAWGCIWRFTLASAGLTPRMPLLDCSSTVVRIKNAPASARVFLVDKSGFLMENWLSDFSTTIGSEVLMRSFLFVVFVSVLVGAIGCKDETSPKVVVMDEEATQKLTSGMSRTCIKQERASDAARFEKAIEQDQKQLASMGVLNVIQPTTGELGRLSRVVVDHRAPLPTFPKPSVDILGQLGIVIENQYDGEYGLTDEAIRGVADAAYAKLGILDEGMRNFTLSVRMTDDGAMTNIDAKRKLAIVMISPDMISLSVQHEIAHVLTGTMAGDSDIAHIATEFVAIAGEDDASYGQIRRDWSYDRVNSAILGMSHTINGEAGVIHANNVPLDGYRYDLLRLTDEKIGEAGQGALAKAVYDAAVKRGAFTMSDLRPMFEGAGLGDLALLNETLEPGLYIDLVFMKDGTPVVLAKTVDVDGYEGMTSTSFQVMWRDAEGRSMGGASPQPLQPSTTLVGAAEITSRSASLEVRVGGQPYVFTFGPVGVTNATASGTTPPKSDFHTK